MAAGDIVASWHTRMDWSGQTPTAGNIVLQRFDATPQGSGPNRTLPDGNNPDATWTLRNYTAPSAALTEGRWGKNLRFNLNSPTAEETSLTVPHFPDLWPSGGKMLFRVWAALNYSMSYTPLICTRNTPGKKPLVYLSTLANGRPRAMIYPNGGGALLDQSEGLPWTPTPGEWVHYIWLIDLDGKTSQLGALHRDSGQTFIGPVRSFTGTPNPACEANFEVATLAPLANYWAGGWIDEISYTQPTQPVDMADLVAEAKRSLTATGATTTGITTTDTGVSATVAATLNTGAQQASWTATPAVEITPPITGTPQFLFSTDEGANWTAPTQVLPEAFTGWVQIQVPMQAGETITEIKLVEQETPPVLNPIPSAAIQQNATITRTLTGTWKGTPRFSLTAPAGITANLENNTLTIVTGWDIGTYTLEVGVTDDTDLAGVPQQMTIDVAAPVYEPPLNPVLARAPIQILDGDDVVEVITDAIKAKLTIELNGEHRAEFQLPAAHPKRAAIMVERTIKVADETFKIRKITSHRQSGTPILDIYAEAEFYDLGLSGQVEARQWAGAQAGTTITHILNNTGWTLDKVNVSTVRTWSMSQASPLACLRKVADTHGGDLVFSNQTKTVSLLTQSGRDAGLTFFYGRGVKGAKRVEDTTALITRIIPRNADGLGIAEVNGGLEYVEDYTYTSQVRVGVYDFPTSTNPYTMLAMAKAALAKRAKPAYSYEIEVIDLSAWSGQTLDRFGVGDLVTVIDDELDIRVASRIVRLEYDLIRPWNTKIVLSQKLRELGSGDNKDATQLTTGTDIDTRDLVPFNLLQNARFDNGMAHWAGSGATVKPGGVTGHKHVEMAGDGVCWIEQTVAPDTRDVYTISFQLGTEGFPAGTTPTVEVIAEVIYDDGTTETITQQVT